MGMINPVTKLLSTATLLLASLVILILSGQTPNITITEWDGNSKYEAVVNNQPITIYLEEEQTETNPPKPGKIKIIFKDSKQQGTTLIYERDMQDGEISPTDQKYIEQVLVTVKDFHKTNNTFHDKIKDGWYSFWKSVQKK